MWYLHVGVGGQVAEPKLTLALALALALAYSCFQTNMHVDVNLHIYTNIYAPDLCNGAIPWTEQVFHTAPPVLFYLEVGV